MSNSTPKKPNTVETLNSKTCSLLTGRWAATSKSTVLGVLYKYSIRNNAIDMDLRSILLSSGGTNYMSKNLFVKKKTGKLWRWH